MTNDKTTLVAVFNDYATAQQAENELLENGFSREDVRLTSNDGNRTFAAGSSSQSSSHHEGGIAGFFHNLFGSDDDETSEDSGHYAEAVSRGSAVVTATVPRAKVEAATTILNRYSPVDFDQQVESFRGTENSRQGDTMRSASGTAGAQTGDRVIPVVQEEIQVGKRAVQRGGVRVYSRITEQPVNESVSLHEERARVERRPVDRAATEADFNLKDEVVEVIETSEEAVVGKTSRVVEEVVVGRESSDRTQTISDTVRRTDVQVERLSPETEQDFRKDYDTRYSTQGASYDAYEPAYGYGYALANDPRYKGKSWNDVESSVQSDYSRENPNSTWDKFGNAVKYGWDRANTRR